MPKNSKVYKMATMREGVPEHIAIAIATAQKRTGQSWTTSGWASQWKVPEPYKTGKPPKKKRK